MRDMTNIDGIKVLDGNSSSYIEVPGVNEKYPFRLAMRLAFPGRTSQFLVRLQKMFWRKRYFAGYECNTIKINNK